MIPCAILLDLGENRAQAASDSKVGSSRKRQRLLSRERRVRDHGGASVEEGAKGESKAAGGRSVALLDLNSQCFLCCSNVGGGKEGAGTPNLKTTL